MLTRNLSLVLGLHRAKLDDPSLVRTKSEITSSANTSLSFSSIISINSPGLDSGDLGLLKFRPFLASPIFTVGNEPNVAVIDNRMRRAFDISELHDDGLFFVFNIDTGR